MPADGSHHELTTDPVTKMDAAAIRLHEIFLALRRAGFTKIQAENFVGNLVEESFTEQQPS